MLEGDTESAHIRRTVFTDNLRGCTQHLALLSWLSPDNLIGNYGLIGLLAIIFAECGLLVGFFLPGDTLLFTAGVLVKKGTFDHPLWYVILLEFLAAVAGNQVGYSIGLRAGPSSVQAAQLAPVQARVRRRAPGRSSTAGAAGPSCWHGSYRSSVRSSP